MMPEFERKADVQSKNRISSLIEDLQILFADDFQSYAEKRGKEVGYLWRTYEGDGLSRMANDLSRIEHGIRSNERLLFIGREYWQRTVAHIPSRHDVALLLPEPGVLNANFALFPGDLTDISQGDTAQFFAAHADLDPQALEAWQKFARLAGSLPVVAGQSLGTGGVHVTTLEKLFRRSFRDRVYWEAETESSVYTHLGRSEFDNNVGYHSTDLSIYCSLLEKSVAVFRTAHAPVIEEFGLEPLLSELKTEAENFPGTTRYERYTG